MGTLGCINDMLQRDKENRELRKLSKERLKETRNRLMKIGSSTKLPDTSVEEMKEIRKKTIEKEKADATTDSFNRKGFLFRAVATPFFQTDAEHSFTCTQLRGGLHHDIIDDTVITGDFGYLDRFGQFQIPALLNFHYRFHVQSILKAVVHNHEGDTAGLTCIDLIVAGDTVLFQ